MLMQKYQIHKYSYICQLEQVNLKRDCTLHEISLPAPNPAS